ncbi:hypothetical protein N751_17205 [Legionella pneumophila str. Leg01/11]|nr:hypothetical protein N751_17205 [Legionella pneumophila str. Leg01/11]
MIVSGPIVKADPEPRNVILSFILFALKRSIAVLFLYLNLGV